MLAAILALPLLGLPNDGCVHEAGARGQVASTLESWSQLEIPATGDPARTLERFAAAHRAGRAAVLKERLVTIEGDPIYNLLATSGGKLWVGYDGRQDQWGVQELVLCRSPSERLEVVSADRDGTKRRGKVLRFVVPADMKCTIGPELPLSDTTERRLATECSREPPS